MPIKFIHQRGSDNKLNRQAPLSREATAELTPIRVIILFTTTRRLTVCPILAIISLALADEAFDAINLTDASRVFRFKN